MNTIKSNNQFLGRIIESLGSENIVIYNSDRDYEFNDECLHCHTSTDVINIMRTNLIKVIIMCSHKVRWGTSIHEIVSHLEDSKKFGNRQISFHSDETHAYINKNRENIEQLINLSILRQFRMYSATPFPIWKVGVDVKSIWNKIYIVNVENMYKLVKNDKYYGVKDCEFIPSDISYVYYGDNTVSYDVIELSKSANKIPTWLGPGSIFDLGDEIKYLQYIEYVLPNLQLDHNSFSYNFIPSYKRKITQYEIMNIILRIYPTSNVIVMNGNDTGMTLFTKSFKPVGSNPKILEPSEQIEDILYRKRVRDLPTFIVGFQTCNMSVTLINENIGNFDNMIFYHDHLMNDPECLYQMMRVVFSYINWDIYHIMNMKTTKIYGHPEVYRIIIDYEKAVEKIESLNEGEYIQDEIRGNVPIKQNKKKIKLENHLQQIPEEYINHDIQSILVTSNNEGKKWKQVEEEYFEFMNKELKGPSDPRTKMTSDGKFILNGSMGGKFKGKHVDIKTLSNWTNGLSWYSNFAITENKYIYIRIYVGYKNLEDPSRYTIYLRTVELEKNDEVDKFLKLYENSDKVNL
tara:strand:+ start:158 stop:1879 length:1722 start_codon:yes stop_codon:yes gene_type:complete